MSAILCIDTASERFALAVDRDTGVSSFQAEQPQEHSRLLLPAIQRLLGGDALAAILVVIGPGAYAGIRVGIATAEGLSLARDVPLFGIGTLEAVALAAAGDLLTAIHPAGRGSFAAQQFEAGAPLGKPALAETLPRARPLAGEGAGTIGGIEIGALQRCEAALRDRAPKIRAGRLEPGAEAFYLREPSITVSRRTAKAS